MTLRLKGEGSGFRNNSTKAFVLKSVTSYMDDPSWQGESLPFSIQGDLSQSMKETPSIPKINIAEAKMFQ